MTQEEKIKSKLLLLFEYIKIYIVGDNKKIYDQVSIYYELFDVTVSSNKNNRKQILLKLEIEKLLYVISYFEKNKESGYFLMFKYLKLLNMNKRDESIDISLLYSILLYVKLVYDIYNMTTYVTADELLVCNKLWDTFNNEPDKSMNLILTNILKNDIFSVLVNLGIWIKSIENDYTPIDIPVTTFDEKLDRWFTSNTFTHSDYKNWVSIASTVS